MSPDKGAGSGSTADDAGKGADVGQAEVQATVDAEEEKGYRGTTDDPGDYTVAGSAAGKNTPETDKDQK